VTTVVIDWTLVKATLQLVGHLLALGLSFWATGWGGTSKSPLQGWPKAVAWGVWICTFLAGLLLVSGLAQWRETP
jgi:hypothetical protein